MSGSSFDVRPDPATSLPINHIYYTRKGSSEGQITAVQPCYQPIAGATLPNSSLADYTDSQLCRYLVWPLVILMTSIITICKTTWELGVFDGHFFGTVPICIRIQHVKYFDLFAISFARVTHSIQKGVFKTNSIKTSQV